MKENGENQKIQKMDVDQYLLIPIFLVLLIFATVESRAEESAVQINSSEVKAVDVVPTEVEAKKLSLNLGLEYSSNLMSNSNPDKEDSTSLIIKTSYKFSEKSNLTARVDINQSYNSEKRTKATNTLLAYQITAKELNKELQFLPIVAIVLPTDETIRYSDSYRGSISLRPALEYQPSKIKGLVLSESIQLSKHFHEFEYKRDFSANNEYALKNRLIISYELNDKWALEFVNDYVKGFTYKGYQHDAFYFAQEISYNFKKDWSVYAGHTNEGSVRGPNNQGNNLALADQKSSVISLGVSRVF